MEPDVTLYLAALILIAALLYSSVGYGGASGYLAVMALFGLAPLEMKPAALTLNVVVAILTTIKYTSAGCFNWRVFRPFALVSVPFAFLGGLLTLPEVYYKPCVGAILIYAAWRLFTHAGVPGYAVREPPVAGIAVAGAALGFVAGLTGVGSGIFLSALLVFLRWADVKQVAGIAAAFILVNSIAGLLGFMASARPELPEGLPIWAIAAALGGFIGAEYGSRRLDHPVIKRLLAIVLFIAGAKMLATVH
jgi:uncharacterized membrane protein YfcA